MQRMHGFIVNVSLKERAYGFRLFSNCVDEQAAEAEARAKLLAEDDLTDADIASVCVAGPYWSTW